MWMSHVTVFSGGTAGALAALRRRLNCAQVILGTPWGHHAWQLRSAPPAQPRSTRGSAPPRADKIQQLFKITLLYKINKGLLSSTAGLMIAGHHLREWCC